MCPTNSRPENKTPTPGMARHRTKRDTLGMCGCFSTVTAPQLSCIRNVNPSNYWAARQPRAPHKILAGNNAMSRQDKTRHRQGMRHRTESDMQKVLHTTGESTTDLKNPNSSMRVDKAGATAQETAASEAAAWMAGQMRTGHLSTRARSKSQTRRYACIGNPDLTTPPDSV